MTVSDILVVIATDVRNELLLFAGLGLLIGGIDDLALDLVYGARRLWRALTVYSRFPHMTADRLPRSASPGTMAVFIPAWDESAVIGNMLRTCLNRWAREDVHLFVGVYPNDVTSIVAVANVAASSDRVTMIINPGPGPTTKADCLNALWRGLLSWEGQRGRSAKAVILHDAEDVVHRDALHVMSAMIDRFALVQLPVLPLVTPHSRWIAGHYGDEFAEAHAKAMTVREALGAALPSAGVGCAIARDMMGMLASARGGRPFDAEALTEDYEMGLRIGELGGRGVLVRMRDRAGELVATREYFPDTVAGAVKQKARWTTGIALAGWDRLGWSGGLVESWMRLHDRRAMLSALVLGATYAGLVLAGLFWLATAANLHTDTTYPDPLPLLYRINGVLLGWRVVMRMMFVYRAYGLCEALRSPFRMIVANIIAMMAARRALGIYLRLWAGEAPHWDKTAHRFPELDAT